MAVSPTQLSLRHLRDEGWLVDICERWVPGGPSANGNRRDLFGCLDLVAVRGTETLGVQVTAAGNVSARLAKLTDETHLPVIRALTNAGWAVVIHGWRLTTRDGHACNHARPRCGCRWVLHRHINVTAEVSP